MSPLVSSESEPQIPKWFDIDYYTTRLHEISCRLSLRIEGETGQVNYTPVSFDEAGISNIILMSTDQYRYTRENGTSEDVDYQKNLTGLLLEDVAQAFLESIDPEFNNITVLLQSTHSIHEYFRNKIRGDIFSSIISEILTRATSEGIKRRNLNMRDAFYAGLQEFAHPEIPIWFNIYNYIKSLADIDSRIEQVEYTVAQGVLASTDSLTFQPKGSIAKIPGKCQENGPLARFLLAEVYSAFISSINFDQLKINNLRRLPQFYESIGVLVNNQFKSGFLREILQGWVGWVAQLTKEYLTHIEAHPDDPKKTLNNILEDAYELVKTERKKQPSVKNK